MKKSVYIGIVIIIVMLIAICTFTFLENNKKEITTNANTIVQNKQEENEQINEQSNEVFANDIENEIENTVATENVVENTSSSSETFEENPQTAEEKAIEIAKNDWGESSNVKFSVEAIDENGNYVVTVRNSQTTEALAFYSVNVTSKTFTKREMN